MERIRGDCDLMSFFRISPRSHILREGGDRRYPYLLQTSFFCREIGIFLCVSRQVPGVGPKHVAAE
jgi:hypothetical protein